MPGCRNERLCQQAGPNRRTAGRIGTGLASRCYCLIGLPVRTWIHGKPPFVLPKASGPGTDSSSSSKINHRIDDENEHDDEDETAVHGEPPFVFSHALGP